MKTTAFACLLLCTTALIVVQPTASQTLDDLVNHVEGDTGVKRQLLQFGSVFGNSGAFGNAGAAAGNQGLGRRGGASNANAAAQAAADGRGRRRDGANANAVAQAASTSRQQQPFLNDIPSILNNAVISGQSTAAASAIATAGSRGEATAAAESLATQIGAGRTDTVAEAVAQASATDATATATVLAQTARRARNRGFTNQFARSQARAFAVARRNGRLNQYTTAVAEAIATGGSDASQAYGEAFARAAAGSADEQAALAEATAVAFCQGGRTSRAFASAYAEAINRDPRTGCLVLSRARAIAVAQCRGGVASSYAQATAESRVLGFCRQTYPTLPGLSSFNLDRVTERGYLRLGSLLSGLGNLFG
eukprot:GHUV01001506.1.p1 GENE.GHUV01001506.1~~GHUV01001506.1.p1  ORF type:complete len:366 (+),score=111.97 GHUV01001506.1:189-1286(+)